MTSLQGWQGYLQNDNDDDNDNKDDDKLARMTRILTEWQWWRQWWQGWWLWWWCMWPWQGWRRGPRRSTCPQAEPHNPVVCNSHSVLQYPSYVLTHMCKYTHTQKHRNTITWKDKLTNIQTCMHTHLHRALNLGFYILAMCGQQGGKGHQHEYQCQQDRSRLSADLFNPVGNCCICFISFHLAQHDPATTSSGQHPMNHHCPIVQQIGCEQLLSGLLTLSIWDNLCFECFVNSATRSWLHNGLTSI